MAFYVLVGVAAELCLRSVSPQSKQQIQQPLTVLRPKFRVRTSIWFKPSRRILMLKPHF